MASKKDYAADVAYLRKTVPYYAKRPPKPTATAHRVAQGIRAQKAAGLPVNIPAARGHLVTPEHPNRRRPKLPMGTTVTKYRGGNLPKSKYLRKTVPLDKPIIHKRPINPPERLNLSNGAVVDVFYDDGPLIQRLVDLGPSWRVVLAGFDCSLGIWRELGVNRGHNRGWSADGPEESDGAFHAIIPTWEYSRLTFEEWFISVANGTDSDPEQAAERMTHVCMWRLYAYPAESSRGRLAG